MGGLKGARTETGIFQRCVLTSPHRGRQVAEECLKKAGDLSGLLLLATAKGSPAGLGDLVEAASAQNRQNVVFLCQLLLGNLSACVDLLLASGRIPEAAFFARTYLPSRMTEVRAPSSTALPRAFLFSDLCLLFPCHCPCGGDNGIPRALLCQAPFEVHPGALAVRARRTGPLPALIVVGLRTGVCCAAGGEGVAGRPVQDQRQGG